VLVPTVVGVGLRTRFPDQVARFDPVYSAGGSLVYLALLLAVLGPNAATIRGYGWYALVIAAAALTLNLIGYTVGSTARWFTDDPRERIAYLFTVSKKEFSIAAAFVAASGLPAEIAVPAVFFAVIQMITSPVAARLLAARARRTGPLPSSESALRVAELRARLGEHVLDTGANDRLLPGVVPVADLALARPAGERQQLVLESAGDRGVRRFHAVLLEGYRLACADAPLPISRHAPARAKRGGWSWSASARAPTSERRASARPSCWRARHKDFIHSGAPHA
jgi:hypothetical protein